ncbi:MAG: LytTR family DNA-binding domain-containing protein [Bacteroidota bacterium]
MILVFVTEYLLIHRLSNRYSLIRSELSLFPDMQIVPKIMVSDTKSIHMIPLHEIKYLEAQGSYTRIVSDQHDIIASRPLCDYIAQIGGLPFYRTHNSYLVNLNSAIRYDKQSRYILLDNEEKIMVSCRRREGLIGTLQAMLTVPQISLRTPDFA